MEISNWLASGALLVALASFVLTWRYSRVQNKLNRHQLKKVEAEERKEKSAIIDGRLTDKRLIIFNKGKASAKNIRLEFPDGNERVLRVESKFPLPILDPQKSVKLFSPRHMGTPDFVKVKFTWDDEVGKENEKEVTLYEEA